MDRDVGVTVVIVTHNSEAVIAGALDSIPRGCAIVCVDNGSEDRTCELVSQYPLQLIRNGNIGFGGACNRGAEAAETEYLLFPQPRREAVARHRRQIHRSD